MKLAAIVVLSLLGAGTARSQDDDVDPLALSNLAVAKQRVQAIDQSAKAASPERKAELQRERAAEVTGIVEIAASRPKSASVNLSGAKVLADVSEPQRSLPFANKAVDLAPTNPEARVVRGNANFALGNYHAAAEDARTALAYDPQNQAAKALLQFSQSRLQDMASRVKVPPKPAFQETGGEPAAEREQRLGGPNTATGTGAASGGDAPGSSAIGRRDFTAAQRMKAGEHLRDAHTKLRLGDTAGASRLAHKATLLAPTDAAVRTEAAFVRLKAGDAPGALQDAALASGLGPKPPAEALLIEAAAAAEAGDYPRVLSAMERAARLAPRYAPLRDLSLGAPSDELVRALEVELSAHFGTAYERAMAKLDDSRSPAALASAAPGPPAAARVARNVLSGVGALLVLGAGLLWLRMRRVED